MNEILIKVLIGLGVVAVIVGLMFGASAIDLFHKKTFLPKYKELEREVWEATPSRINGAVQEIASSYKESHRADSAEKEMICQFLTMSYPDITGDEISDFTLRNYFENCKYGR